MILVFYYSVNQLTELTLIILTVLYKFYCSNFIFFILSIEKLVFYCSVN